ncbi:amino acid adenylation domain-containing protein [Burkholderia gladioli]|uniref:amino acid adenylation domain-containing protein n=1 Tax=Burkholderia gladioli TaxID=28095 RepID=UPI001640CFD2|nr:non-ribosomal peptide synthetase [Burkholderia gladioli]
MSSVASELSNQMRERLSRRIRQVPVHSEPRLPIGKAIDPDQGRLSFAQEGMWLFQHLNPASTMFNLGSGIRFDGELDAASLGEALNALVRRHRSLRTRFPVVGDQPVQCVLADTGVALQMVDLSEPGELGEPGPDALAARERRLLEISQAEIARPFDLEAAPPIRFRLLRLAPQRHVLFFVAHHIVFDGWSFGVLQADLAALYNARVAGRPDALPDLPLDYVDFAQWQRERSETAAFQGSLDYWRKTLDGASAYTLLPLDRLRERGGQRVGQVAFWLEPEVRAGLIDFARRQSTTPYVVVLAVFQAFLSALCRQPDLVVATPTTNRHFTELHGLIGNFAQVVLLRTRVTGQAPFTVLLKQVHEAVFNGIAHNEVPYEITQRLLDADAAGAAPGQAHGARANVSFVWDDTPMSQHPLAGLQARREVFAANHNSTDLSLIVASNVRPDATLVTLEYCMEQIDADTARHWSVLLQRLLAGVVDAPEASTQHLLYPPEDELRVLTRHWSGVDRPVDDLVCVHRQVLQQARAAADAPAIVYGERVLAYAELASRANRLAHHLRSAGVGLDSVVGLCLARDERMVISLLAIWLAGAAFLPLDPDYPTERLRFLIADSGVEVVVSDTAGIQRVALDGVRLVDLDAEQAHIEACPSTPPEPGVGLDHLAYVLYTSGSTGRPNGVMGTHRALASRLRWDGGDPATVYASKTTINAIDSLWEFFMPLTRGSHVEIIAQHAVQDPTQLLAALRDTRVDRVVLVPTLLRALLEDESDLLGTLTGVREWSCSGEPLPAELVERMRDRLPGLALKNVYGTSEFWDAIEQDCGSLPERRTMPIGRVIDGARMFILDERMQPVAVGLAGELYAGGNGLARGYLRRAALTAERFVPSPFGVGERLYRTGDICRWRSDGSMEFLGRKDDQIKVRGHRIDPGEVVAALQRCPGVAQAVAVLHEADATPRLVAYYTRVPGEGVRGEPQGAIRRRLADLLPSHAIPSALVEVDEIPLLPNGKVHRAALPVPRFDAFKTAYQAPRGTDEQALAAIWSEVLGVERIGAQDSFFDLGGHSLLAMKVLVRVRRLLEVEVPLAVLLNNETLSQQADAIGIERRRHASVLLPVLRASPRESGPANVPLSLAQERLWLLDQLGIGGAAYTIPVTARLRGRLDVEAFRRGVADLVDRHDTLRTRIVTAGGQAAQVIDAPDGFALPVIDLRDEDEAQQQAQVDRLIRAEILKPFDLRQGGETLFRAMLILLGETESIVFVNLHHIVGDGLSIEVMMRDLSLAYRRHSAEMPLPAARPLAIQYGDYAIWQREWMQGAVLDKQIAYWREALADAPAHLNLPADRPRPPLQSMRGATVSVPLPFEVEQRVKETALALNATSFMVLLAAFKLLLFRWTGQDDVVVGTPSAGRIDVQTEDLIGFFMNTLPLRTKLSAGMSLRELVQSVKLVALGAYAHQDLPFERLVEELQPPRDLSRQPLVQVMINSLNFPATEAIDTGLQVERLGSPDEPSKYDLTLYIDRRGPHTRLAITYAADLFEPSRMDSLLDQFVYLLEQFDGALDMSLTDIPLARGERGAADRPAAQAARDLPWAGPVARRVAQWAERIPEVIAVADGVEEISYADLERDSNRLAHLLQARSIGAGDIVALFTTRNARLAWAMLGVQKAGAAVLVLDASNPVERLAGHLSAVDVAACIALDALPEDLAESAALRACRYLGVFTRSGAGERQGEGPGGGQGEPGQPDWRSALAAYPDTPLALDIAPGDLAYIIFTSGTTGVPQPVATPHLALSHFLDWQARRFELSRFDRFSVLSGLGHDPLFRDIFAGLWSGALVAMPDERARIGGELLRWLIDTGVTIAHLTPSLADSMQFAEAGQVLMSMRYVFFGGEALAPDVVERLSRLAIGCEVVNCYGATETPQVISYATIATTGLRDSGPISIGQGIDGVELVLRSAAGRPVAFGEIGEICVVTPYLADGYYRMPAATAERFVPSPFHDGGRMYRTGDLGRYLHDGHVEFVGRRDGQFKIRGHRVEPSEIEACIGACDGVGTCYVTSCEGAQGSEVVAYVVPARSAGGEARERLDFRQIDAALARRLPDYMRPGSYVQMERMPVTSNGKLDRKALPHPDAAHRIRPQEYVAPTSATEHRLAQLWAEVLGLARVGVRDNFFRIGGHSLLAVRLVARIRETFGTQVSLLALFERPTIAELAERYPEWAARLPGPDQADASVAGTAGEPLDALVLLRAGSSTPLFLFHPIGGGLGSFDPLIARLDQDQTIFGIHAYHDAFAEAPEVSIEEMARLYLYDIRRLQAVGPYRLAGYSAGGMLAFEAARQLREAGCEVSLLAMIDSEAPPTEVGLDVDAQACWRYFLEHMRHRMKNPGGFAVETGMSLSEPARIAWLCTCTYTKTKTGDFAETIYTSAEIRDQFEVYRRHHLARKRYACSSADLEILFFLASQEPARQHSPAQGWLPYARRGIELVPVSASHYSILLEPGVGEIAQRLATAL